MHVFSPTRMFDFVNSVVMRLPRSLWWLLLANALGWGLVRAVFVPNTFLWCQLLMSYQLAEGFVKRSLVGSLLAFAGHAPTTLEAFHHVVIGMEVLAFVLVATSFWLTRKVWVDGRNFFLLVVLAASPLWAWFVGLTGYFDPLLMGLGLLGVVAMMRSNWRNAALIMAMVTTLGVLVHESFLFCGAPGLVFALVLKWRLEKRSTNDLWWLAVTILPMMVIVYISLFDGLLTWEQDHKVTLALKSMLASDLYADVFRSFTIYTTSLNVHVDSMQTAVWYNPDYWFMGFVTLLGFVPVVVWMGMLVTTHVGPLLSPKDRRDLPACLMGLLFVPVLLSFAGSDIERWVGGGVTNVLIVTMAVAALRTEPWVVTRKILLLGVVVVLLGMITPLRTYHEDGWMRQPLTLWMSL